MITKCYLFTHEPALIAAISKLIMSIPCFIDTKAIDKNHFEFYIKCREEDVKTVENRLARFV